jgi:hypothetical protein
MHRGIKLGLTHYKAQYFVEMSAQIEEQPSAILEFPVPNGHFITCV